MHCIAATAAADHQKCNNIRQLHVDGGDKNNSKFLQVSLGGHFMSPLSQQIDTKSSNTKESGAPIGSVTSRPPFHSIMADRQTNQLK